MSTFNSKAEFLRSTAAASLREELQSMVDDPCYNTRLRYSSLMQGGSHFITKHMEYMSNYPHMDHMQYLSNLKLMTRIDVPKSK